MKNLAIVLSFLIQTALFSHPLFYKYNDLGQIDAGSSSSLRNGPTEACILNPGDRISTPSITVTYPNAVDTFYANDQITLTWTSTAVSRIKIEYSTNSGVTWNPIATAIDAILKSFNWKIPDISSSSVRIRISDLSDFSNFDCSNSDFSVHRIMTSVYFIEPNAQSVWKTGTEHTIKCGGSIIIGTVFLQYTTNGGTSWINIDRTVIPGDYSWTVPDSINSNQCKIRVYDNIFADTVYAVSQNFSIINRDTLQLFSPNGNEVWFHGESHTISWLQDGDTKVRIQYSTNNGLDWLPVTDSTSGNYNWQIPNTISNECRIQITDILNLSIKDISDTVFTIGLPTDSIFIEKPIGGSLWPVLSTQEIRWTDYGVFYAIIDYSTDNGRNWTGIESTFGNSYFWEVPNLVSDSCRIRISDYENPLVYDVSDIFSFTQPTLQLITPNGGEEWKVGDYKTINWDHYGVRKVKLEYKTLYNGNWTIIVDSVLAENKSYVWQIPNAESVNCKVRVSYTDLNYIRDESDTTFSIVPNNYQFNFTSPAGGESWTVGSTKLITWVQVSVNELKLEYSTDNGVSWILISQSVPANDWQYSWVVPNTVSSDCLIRASASNIPSLIVISNPFSIIPPNLKIVFPNGNQNLFIGSTINITWLNDQVNYVDLEYTTNYGASWTQIAASIPADSGYFRWTIPDHPSDSCKIKIKSITDGSIQDESDSTFTISAPPIKSIVLDSPNGSESWRVGSIFDITWKSSQVNNIKLEYTVDDGLKWNIINGYTQASIGKYNWEIPNTPGTQCRVKITDIDDSLVWDQSDNLFNILAAKSLLLKSLNGGENVKSNGKFVIGWESQQISQVAVEFSINGGETWSLIATIDASTGTYIWDVPGNVTNQGKIRIFDAQDTTLKDQSQGVFTIYEYPTAITGSKMFSFSGKAISDYRMIGKPGSSSSKTIINYMSPGTFMEDYSVFDDNGTVSTNKTDYLLPYTDVFNPGRAYWILSTKPVKFGDDTEPAISTNEYGNYAIPLNPTWTMITNPFEKTVDWDRVRQENGLAQNTLLHAFNEAWTTSAILAPFTGYYFYNTTGLTHLKVPYDPNGSLQKSGPAEGVIQLNGKVLSIDAVQDARSMSKLQVSIDPNSTVDYDTTDYFAAPSTFEEVSITINSPELRTAYKRLQAESRPMSDNGLTFDIQFHNVSGNQTNLNVSGLDLFPDEEVFIYDTQIRKFYDLKETRSIIVPAHVKNRKYSLLIGTRSFIDSEKEKNTVSEFALMQNYPNPFNPQTVITYSIKEPANVTLSVYDVSGSLIGRLVDGYRSEGYHEAVFDAKNLASGVYIYQLDVRNGDNTVYTETRKMSLLK